MFNPALHTIFLTNNKKFVVTGRGETFVEFESMDMHRDKYRRKLDLMGQWIREEKVIYVGIKKV